MVSMKTRLPRTHLWDYPAQHGTRPLEIDCRQKLAHEFANTLRCDALLVFARERMIGFLEAKMRPLIVPLRMDMHFQAASADPALPRFLSAIRTTAWENKQA
jgi:hypothetical protein